MRTIFSALAPRNNKNEEKKFRRGEASREKIQAATDHGGRAADGAVEKPPKVRWKSGTFSAALALLHNHRALSPCGTGSILNTSVAEEYGYAFGRGASRARTGFIRM